MLIDSLKNHCVKFDEPWYHISFAYALTNKQIGEIINADIDKSNHVHDGTRSGSNTKKDSNSQFREFISKENIYKYPNLLQLIHEMQTPECYNLVKDILKDDRDYSNSYVRLEILRDLNGFWLQPHIDIPEKLISCLIYINCNGEDFSLGTDLYDTNKNYVKTLPFINNTGYMFNDPNAWHGFEKKNIKQERRGLQINYVTYETDWKVLND